MRAVDAASNLSGYSNIVGATTQSGGGAPPGLVAAYAFDEAAGSTLSDASGNGNTGTISGATWTSGRYSYGLAFNGSSARVNVQDAPSLDLTSAMTLEAWVKPTTVTSSWRDVIYKGNDNYYLMATSSPGGTARPVGGATIAGVHQEAFGTVAITANTFTHLATTYDGSAVRLFVNGTQVASTAATGSIATSTNQLQIGGDSIYGQYFAGTIDEVRIYNTALTQAQIQADMNSPIGSGSSDTQPPTTPTAVTATGVTSGEIDVTWTPVHRQRRCRRLPDHPQRRSGRGRRRTRPSRTSACPRARHTPIRCERSTEPGTALRRRRRATGIDAELGHAIPERRAGDRLRPADQYRVPPGRSHAGRGAAGQDPRAAAAVHSARSHTVPAAHQRRLRRASQQGLYDIVLDPNFTTNHYYYVFYTTATPNKDRLSRFTANASLTGTINGSEVVLYQDPITPNPEHHGGALAFGNDGKLYFTTGEHFQPQSPRT